MSVPLPPKKEVALALLERSSVHVHLDPRSEGAIVPAWFKKQPQLVLQIGLNMPVPIPDLRLDEEGLRCTLSFNRTPFFCVVPWPSVYAMVGDDGRGMVWPDDVPPEVASQAKGRETDGVHKKEPKRAPGTSTGASTGSHASDGADGKARAPAVRAAQADAAAGGPAVVGPSGKPKKPRKRARPEEPNGAPEARPRAGLVAVPSTPQKKPLPQPVQAKAHASDGGPPNTRAIQAEQRRPPHAAPRPKRELPPYLRVVK